MPDVGFLNDTFMPLHQVRISADDRGFQFGDGVYEVVMVYGGIPCFLGDHLARLEQSAKGIHLPLPIFSAAEWEQRIGEGVKRSGYQDCKVYIQVTRGVVPRDHLFPIRCRPTVFMSFRQIIPPDASLQANGVKVITVPDIRWGRCDIKSLNLLPNVLGKQQAKEAGALEAIFIREGKVMEGTASNVMVVRNGEVHTPEANHHILAGVTRKVLLDLAKKDGLSVCERAVDYPELFEAEEIFLAGSTIEVLPVVTVDEKPVGSGQPGPISQRLSTSYKEFIRCLK